MSYFNDVWTSVDSGATWQLATSNATFSPRYSHSLVYFKSSLVLMGGQNSYGNLRSVWSSFACPTAGTYISNVTKLCTPCAVGKCDCHV